MAAVQKGCEEPYTAADYERGDDVGGCTFVGIPTEYVRF